jgi:hypothetical protein
MKFSTFFLLTSLLSSTKADLGYVPGDNFSTFSPTGGFLDGATTQFLGTFGIAINPIISSVQLTSVSTASNGSIVTQIVNSQPQPITTTLGSTNSPIVVTQIGDGQIQAATKTPSPSFNSINVVTQIGDGQIQATTLITKVRPLISTSSTCDTDTGVVTTRITKIIKQFVTVPYQADTTPTSAPSDDSTTTFYITPTETVTNTVTSLTLPTLAPTTVVLKKRLGEETATVLFSKRDIPTSCSSETALSMILKDSVLIDSQGRIGAIVSNRQFQFDGPTPQAGTIYAAGWNIVDGKLALGKNTVFFQCLSGNFYNLYDTNIGPQCTAVELDVVLFADC